MHIETSPDTVEAGFFCAKSRTGRYTKVRFGAVVGKMVITLAG